MALAPLCLLIGFGLIFAGGGRLFRISAGLLGAWVGFIWGPHIANTFGHFGPDSTLALTCAGGMGLLGAAFPPLMLFFACGVPVGLIIGTVAGAYDYPIGFLPGFLLAGLTGALFYRALACVVTALGGAWLFGLAFLALFHGGFGLGEVALHRPLALVFVALVVALAGATYQIAVHPSPEELQRKREERQARKTRVDEQRRLERRWGSFKEP